MSDGRLPMLIGPGNVEIITDSIYGPFTNREVSFPLFPTYPKGYIKDGYGLYNPSVFNRAGGYVTVSGGIVGYDERIESGTNYYYVFRTPKFGVSVSQDDVINKIWSGWTFQLTADQTTNVWSYTDPGPAVLVSSTPTPQTFSYTFSSSDDPIYGSSDYVAPNSTIKTVLGTEYPYQLEDTISPTYPVSYTYTITDPLDLDWKVTAITPP